MSPRLTMLWEDINFFPGFLPVVFCGIPNSEIAGIFKTEICRCRIRVTRP